MLVLGALYSEVLLCVLLVCSASELIMRTESLLVSSPQKSGRHDVTLNSASHSVVRIPPRHSGPAYDVVAILDPATRAAQKYTPVIMVSICLCHLCQFPEPEPSSAGGASLLPDCLCGTVFRLLCRDLEWHCTLSSDNSVSICSTSDVPTNRRNIHHCPALLWHFSWYWRQIQNCQLTYLLAWLQPFSPLMFHVDCWTDSRQLSVLLICTNGELHMVSHRWGTTLWSVHWPNLMMEMRSPG